MFKIEPDIWEGYVLCRVTCPAQLRKGKQLQAYYGMLGGAPGTLGRSVLSLVTAVSLKPSSIQGNAGCIQSKRGKVGKLGKRKLEF